MSDQLRFQWISGRLAWGPIKGFWGPTLTERDPEVPNLPLETAAAGGAITGSLSITLDSLTLSATGTLSIAGTATQTLGMLTGSETGALFIEGDLAGQLGVLTLSADADVELTGALAQSLEPVTLASAGIVGLSGALEAELGALTLAATGELSAVVIVAPDEGSHGSALAGRPRRRWRGRVLRDLAKPLWPRLPQPETPRAPIAGRLEVTLGSLKLVATGQLKATGSANLKLNALHCAATGRLDWSAVIEEDDEVLLLKAA